LIYLSLSLHYSTESPPLPSPLVFFSVSTCSSLPHSYETRRGFCSTPKLVVPDHHPQACNPCPCICILPFDARLVRLPNVNGCLLFTAHFDPPLTTRTVKFSPQLHQEHPFPVKVVLMSFPKHKNMRKPLFFPQAATRLMLFSSRELHP